jgi:hypothetical protein
MTESAYKKAGGSGHARYDGCRKIGKIHIKIAPDGAILVKRK